MSSVEVGADLGWNKGFLLILLLSVITLFSFLGTPGLKEPDEGRYAEIGREMALSNDWLIPHLNGFEHFQKPPVIYWLTAIAIKTFGANEWAARLPAALSAFGTVLLVFWIGSWFFGSKTGFTAALLMASSFEFFVLARTLNTDMALTFWTTASTAFFLRWTITPESRRWEWLSFASLGMAFLTKGPVALIVPLSVMILVAIHARTIDAHLPIRWFRGMLLTFGIGLSWFAAVVCVHPELVRYFLGFELFQRTVGKGRGREQPFWFYFTTLAIGLFPWTFFVSSAAVARLRKISLRKFSRPDIAIGAWILAPFVILSVVRSKLPTYLLPLYPALALFAADWICNRASGPLIRRIAAVSAVVAIALPAVSLLLPYLSHQTKQVQPQVQFIGIEAALLLCTGAAVLWAALRSDPRRMVVTLAGGSISAWIAGFSMLDLLDNDFGEQASVRPIATLLNAAPDIANAVIYCIGTRAHGIEFYTGKYVCESVDKADLAFPPSADQKARLIDNNDSWEWNLPSDQPVYLVTTRSELPKLRQRWNELGESGSYVLAKRLGN
jgi:4-amino-4-deoxy-L-arabinose transferase-like glycosyltransferase